ncbi:MAG: hypothetical protein GY786_19065 [Proteobacteria bacterium]|nr:hypothetical protein [Pseudomonadota bacterium]
MGATVEIKENLESFFGELNDGNQMRSYNLRIKVLRGELDEFFAFVGGEDEGVELEKKKKNGVRIVSNIFSGIKKEPGTPEDILDMNGVQMLNIK